MISVVVFFSFFSLVHPIQVGKIENYILIDTISFSFVNITQNECLCKLIESISNFTSAINYFPIHQTCQLFYLNQTSLTIEMNLNSSFIFINQSIISITESK